MTPRARTAAALLRVGRTTAAHRTTLLILAALAALVFAAWSAFGISAGAAALGGALFLLEFLTGEPAAPEREDTP